MPKDCTALWNRHHSRAHSVVKDVIVALENQECFIVRIHRTRAREGRRTRCVVWWNHLRRAFGCHMSRPSTSRATTVRVRYDARECGAWTRGRRARCHRHRWWWRWRDMLALVVACVWLRDATAASDVGIVGGANVVEASSEAFVRVRRDGRGFERGNACLNSTDYDGDFVFRGFNAYLLMELGAEIKDGSFGRDWSGGAGRETVRALLDDAREADMNIIRTWAFSVNHARPLWDASGTYDEELLVGLDFVLSEASERGVFAVLALADYWQAHGGVLHFLKTCGVSSLSSVSQMIDDGIEDDDSSSSSSDREFFESPRCRAMYRAHVTTILSRVNTFTGRAYKDDPTIAAFNLMNEPRCRGCGDALQAWIDDMSVFFRDVDAGHHMLTVGEEGFYARDTPSELGADGINPAPWASTTGQDFVRNHASRNIHFTTAHIWKDNWAVYAPAVRFDAERFTRRWISAHEADARILGKPLVIEEFGSAPGGVRRVVQTNRAQSAVPPSIFSRVTNARRIRRDEDDVEDYYRGVFSQVARSIANDDGYIRGALFWVMYPESMRRVAEIDALDPFAVFPSDGAFALARRFASHVVALTSTTRGGDVRSSSCHGNGSRY